jgi:hypothetical protein
MNLGLIRTAALLVCPAEREMHRAALIFQKFTLPPQMASI